MHGYVFSCTTLRSVCVVYWKSTTATIYLAHHCIPKWTSKNNVWRKCDIYFILFKCSAPKVSVQKNLQGLQGLQGHAHSAVVPARGLYSQKFLRALPLKPLKLNCCIDFESSNWYVPFFFCKWDVQMCEWKLTLFPNKSIKYDRFPQRRLASEIGFWNSC